MRDLDPPQIRVLGCLLEKQRTTPDTYPLTLNSLRLACNQATNRDPVTDYDEATVRDAAQRLGRAGLTRLASGAGSRAPKYRHMLTEVLGLARDEQAILAVLLLRGPQTPGELKQRAERLNPFPALADVEDTLRRLAARDLVARIGRRPGQKEARHAHLLGESGAEGAEAGQEAGADDAPPAEVSVAAAPPAGEEGTADELAGLRREVEGLRAAVADLAAAVEALQRRSA